MSSVYKIVCLSMISLISCSIVASPNFYIKNESNRFIQLNFSDGGVAEIKPGGEYKNESVDLDTIESLTIGYCPGKTKCSKWENTVSVDFKKPGSYTRMFLKFSVTGKTAKIEPQKRIGNYTTKLWSTIGNIKETDITTMGKQTTSGKAQWKKAQPSTGKSAPATSLQSSSSKPLENLSDFIEDIEELKNQVMEYNKLDESTYKAELKLANDLVTDLKNYTAKGDAPLVKKGKDMLAEIQRKLLEVRLNTTEKGEKSQMSSGFQNRMLLPASHWEE